MSPPFSALSEWELGSTVPARFEQVVRALPDHPALLDDRTSLTYAELHAYATRIAGAIRAHGATPGSPVAILLDHELPVVAAILGVLAAGSAYCVLSPSFPIARLQLLSDDLAASLLLTSSAHRSLALQFARCPILSLDEHPSAPAGMPTSLPGLSGELSPDTPAAIHYTSGSTGAPKGAWRVHHDLLRRARLDAGLFAITPADVSSLLYAASFAGSVRDLFDNLLSGATLALYDIQRAGLAPMANWLLSRRVTVLHINAGVLHQFLEQLPPGAFFPNLRLICPAQRFARADLARLWPLLPPHALVIHQFAGTEAGPVSSLTLTRDTVVDDEIVPVGPAFPEVRIDIVDSSGAPVPPHASGELLVSSPYLARGFWRKPELTAARFTPNPFDPALTTYHTGDLARLRPDGALELVGRTDADVKIRGHQVPLGAVQSALQEHTAVRGSQVVALPDPAGDKQLVAYVVPSRPDPTLTLDLRRHLAARLPAYMLPSRIVLLAEFPLLANGKVDVQSLPPPGSARPELAVPYAPPRTPVETEVAEIWAAILGLDRVGIFDSFLDLGGDSLQASRIISRVIRAFSVDLALRELFESPTVAAMSLQITRRRARQADPDTLARLLARLEAAGEPPA